MGKKNRLTVNELCDAFLFGLPRFEGKRQILYEHYMQFDETIGLVNLLSQDIGRVVLNLITNAFYAVAKKSKQGVERYAPTVTVRTKKLNDQFEISSIR